MEGSVKLLAGEGFWTPAGYDAFRRDGKFVDIDLLSDSDKYPCHRIILARQSLYFKDLFTTYTEPTFKLPENPGSVFGLVVEFLYGTQIQVAPESFASLFRCATFYKIKRLEQYLKGCFPHVMNCDNVLMLARTLGDNDVCAVDEEIAQFVSGTFFAQTLFMVNEFYEAAQPSLMAAVLRQIPGLTDERKIELIDSYVGVHFKQAKVSARDSEILATLVDWSQEKVHEFYLKYKCEWVPARISRCHYVTILRARRNVIGNMVEPATDVVNWLGPFVAISKVAMADESSECDILAMIMTLGGTVKKKVDPVKFGWLEFGSGPLQSGLFKKYFGPEKALVDGEGFRVQGSKEEPPFWQLKFVTDTQFVLKKINFQCVGNYQHREAVEFPKEMTVYSVDNEKPVHVKSIRPKGPDVAKEVSMTSPCRTLMIKMKKTGSTDMWIMRIQRLQLIGVFA